MTEMNAKEMAKLAKEALEEKKADTGMREKPSPAKTAPSKETAR